MAKTRYVGARKSVNQMLDVQKSLKKKVRQTWDSSTKAPMFMKVSKSKGKDGARETTRTNRLISTPAYKIACSGAAQYVATVLGKDAKTLQVKDAKLEGACSWLPSLSPGAMALLEQFLCAYTQEAAKNAVAIKKMKRSERLRADMVGLGFDAADKAIFGGAAPVSRHTIVLPLDKPKAAKPKAVEE